jgi:lysophospholipase L1-like esterase
MKQEKKRLKENIYFSNRTDWGQSTAMKPRLSLLCSLLSLLLLPAMWLPGATNQFTRWEKEITAFERADQTNPPPKNAALFVGSSSIRMWRSLARDFPGYQVINRGFGGSQIVDSTYFAERIVIPHQPRLVVMYAGGNDLNGGKSPEQVLADFQAFVKTVRDRLPQTRIAYISIAPNPARWTQIARIKTATKLIADYIKESKNLVFIDVFPHMLAPDGLPKPDIYLNDQLHMNTNGYAIWREVVGPFLKEKP